MPQINVHNIIFCLLLIFCAGHVMAQRDHKNEKTELSYLGCNPFSTLSDSSLAHDVDRMLFNCLDSSGATTLGDIDCYSRLTEVVLKKIKNEYLKLYAKLDSTDKKLFKKAQTRWNNYFEDEQAFLYSAFYTWSNSSKYGHGREHAIAQAEWLFKMARQRLVALRAISQEI